MRKTMDWFEPKNFGEWSKRLFSLRSVAMTLCVVCVLVSEFRFDWAEQAIGRYLAATNAYRPESGAIWEIGHKADSAQKILEKIVTDRETSQREVLGETSLSKIASSLVPDQGAMVSSDHFRDIYLKLPPGLSQEIISPYDLLHLYNNADIDRIYFKKAGDALDIYLLDDQNLVIRKLTANPGVLSRIEKSDVVWTQPISQVDRFKDRIYPADRFFDGLDALPEDVRRSIVSRPEMLLAASGVITHVGISDEAIAGFIELGFEIETADGFSTITVYGDEWAVWHLRSRLEKSASKPPAADSRPAFGF